MVDIIIKKSSPKGRTRSQIEHELNEEWGGGSCDEEEMDKLKFKERDVKEKLGSDRHFVTGREIDKVK